MHLCWLWRSTRVLSASVQHHARWPCVDVVFRNFFLRKSAAGRVCIRGFRRCRSTRCSAPLALCAHPSVAPERMNFALLVALVCWCASALGATGPACPNGAAYTTSRTWRFAVARPANADGQRVVNSILTMVSQTTTTTSSIYLPYDAMAFNANTDVFEDGCDQAPTVAVAKADALYTTIAGNSPQARLHIWFLDDRIFFFVEQSKLTAGQT